MIPTCERCGKRVRHLKGSWKIRCGSWKNPETNDTIAICNGCNGVWSKRWDEVFGNKKIIHSPSNCKKLLEMWNSFMESGIRPKVKVRFT